MLLHANLHAIYNSKIVWLKLHTVDTKILLFSKVTCNHNVKFLF